MAKAKGGAARKAPGGLTVAVFFRVDSAMIERIDTAKDLRSEVTGVKWARADMMRALLKYALDREESPEPESKAKRKGAKS